MLESSSILDRIRSKFPGELSLSEYAQLARALDAGAPALEKLRLTLLSTYTTEVLDPLLRVESARHGFALEIRHGGFGQLEQALLSDPGRSGDGAPEALLLAMRLEDLQPDLPYRFYSDPEGFERLSEDVIGRIVEVVSLFRERSSGVALVANFAPPEPRPLGVFDANQAGSLTNKVMELNRAVLERLSTFADCHIWDYAGLVASAGASSWTDPRLWALARLPIAGVHQPMLAAHFARTLRAALRPRAKCLVVDLDGVLWGGAVGDEGIGGIVLGDEYPGLAYKEFQRAILGLRDRGILLAVCSKNDREVACEAIRKHPEMLVALDDFATMRIDWRPKSVNLREIADELSIGLDSLVLFDDSPVERGEVSLACPEVEVVPVPADPLSYVRALSEVVAFDAPTLTDEDRLRASQYSRRPPPGLRDRPAGSLEEMLASLGMKARIGGLDEMTARRIAQLVAKTNQFNLTLRRQSQADLEQMVATGCGGVYWLRLSDRFGDLGLICVGVLRMEGKDAVIHNLVLSCRAANRGVEQAMVAHLVAVSRRAGLHGLVGEYIPGPRNHVVADLYPRLGFVEASEGAAIRRFRLDLEKEDVTHPEYIDVEYNAA